MGRKKLSEYAPEIAAQMRAQMQENMRAAWVRREANGLGARKNAASRDDVREQISATLRRRWDEGRYAERVNGMTQMHAAAHPNWTWGRGMFHDILMQYDKPACFNCGRTDTKLDAHHVDEDHDNYLLTNLMWLCVSCHHRRHAYARTPFATLGKIATFEYAHVLPWHPGKCARIHGHSGHLEVRIRGRINDCGVVVDFGDISQAIKLAVTDVIDHQLLNDFISNPTSENVLIWVWEQLSSIGLKGISELTFRETDASWSTLTARDLIDAYGWDIIDGKYVFVAKYAEERDPT